MTSLFNAIIVDNTILFLGTVLLTLMWVVFPETIRRADFIRLKNSSTKMATIDINDVEDLRVEGVDSRDHPDYCDTFFSFGTWKKTGHRVSDTDLEELTENYPCILNTMAFESLI